MTLAPRGEFFIKPIGSGKHTAPDRAATVRAGAVPTSFSKSRARDRPDRLSARPVPAGDNLWLLLSALGCPYELAAERSCLDRLCHPSSRKRIRRCGLILV